MKKIMLFILLIALIAFAMGETCEECLNNCEKAGKLKISLCKSDCILGPCL